MELPNKYFEDFPIEFKKVNRTSVSRINEGISNPNGFTVTKQIHKESRNRYLNEDLQPIIKLEEKNTTVINAPVGNGKSYAIIQTIKRFYDSKEQDYLIIVATPFVSLVEQYVNEIHTKGGVPVEQIYNYNNISRTDKPYIGKKVQVVTANTLLGNPGEDSYKNSDKKRKYLNELIEDCEKNNKKVVFIYDEVHDTIPNFKEEFLFNLWKWKNVIHKNFIISATFTEASFVVIEYLAELTDKKIDIIEFPRIRNKENQSDLFLYYSSSYKFKNTTPEIVNVIEDLLKRNKNIDVLCYSRSLAKSIISDKNIGKKLKTKFGKINDCTSENIDNQRSENEAPQNRFDNTLCNVGTNFKSGVSIEKENHAFVIILPPLGSQGKFKNYYGIFSSGITSVIQAIARQRTKGEIHIILSRPNEFEYDSLKPFMTEEQIDIFSRNYDLVKHYKSLDQQEKISYIPLALQDKLVYSFYKHDLKANVQSGIDAVSETDRKQLARLEFPPYKNFKLNESENYLASSFGFFGGDLSAYITYCAFTNQFVNCYLKGFEYKQVLWFTEGSIQKQLNEYFDEYFGESYIERVFELSNFRKSYEEFRNKLFNEFDLKFKRIKTEDTKEEPTWSNIHEYNNSIFEQELLRFVAFKYYGRSYFYHNDYAHKSRDTGYTRSQYFIDGIASALHVNLEENDYSDQYVKRVQAFLNLNYFREKLIRAIAHHQRGNESYDYLPLNPFPEFITTEDISRFHETIEYFSDMDSYLSNEVYNFKRRVKGTFEKNKTSFYKILIEDFFEYENRENSPQLQIYDKKQPVLPHILAKALPDSSNIINLIQNPESEQITSPDEFKEWLIRKYGSVEAYTEMLIALVNESE